MKYTKHILKVLFWTVSSWSNEQYVYSEFQIKPTTVKESICRVDVQSRNFGRHQCLDKIEILKISGGVQKAKKENKPEENEKPKESVVLAAYKKILPVTRVYLSAVVGLTLISMTGLIDPALFALDPSSIFKKLQLWRPLTASCFLGPPSMGMATNLFFLFRYGTALEGTFGSAQQIVFFGFQMVVLCLLAALVGFPFVASSLVSAALWCCSRENPTEMMQWQFGLVIPQWVLPFGLMGIDILQAQSVFAAAPHILGILSGHFYHFVTSIYPLMGGSNWLKAPTFLQKLLDKDFVEEVPSKKTATSKAPKSQETKTKTVKDHDDDEEEEEEEQETEDKPKAKASTKKKGKSKKVKSKKATKPKSKKSASMK